MSSGSCTHSRWRWNVGESRKNDFGWSRSVFGCNDRANEFETQNNLIIRKGCPNFQNYQIICFSIRIKKLNAITWERSGMTRNNLSLTRRRNDKKHTMIDESL